MFDKEFENKYVFNTRVLNGKTILEKWHPKESGKYFKLLGEYNLAVLGSISPDVIEKTGLDTPAQVVELVNKYSSNKIVAKKDPKKLKEKAILLLRKWNPDDYDTFVSQLSDEELVKLGMVEDNIISAYGLNTLIDIKTCIKMNESGKNNSMTVNLYNGGYNEFLYNTFISQRKIRNSMIDIDIDVKNFDYEFFGFLMENAVNTYIKYHKK